MLLHCKVLLGLLLTCLSVLCHARTGHKYAQELNKSDVCPHTKSDPKDPNAPKMKFMTDMENREWLCCPCNPGEKLMETCVPGNYTSTICQPCEDGTFRKEYTHNYTYCEDDHLKCSLNSVYIHSKQEPRCDCLDGYYKAPDGTCTPHSDCPPGQGVLNRGTRDSDTKCESCPEGYVSTKHSRTEKCSLKQSVLNHPNNKHLNVHKQPNFNLFTQPSEYDTKETLLSTTGSAQLVVFNSSLSANNSLDKKNVPGTTHFLLTMNDLTKIGSATIFGIIMVGLLYLCLKYDVLSKVKSYFCRKETKEGTREESILLHNRDDLGTSQGILNVEEKKDLLDTDVERVTSQSHNEVCDVMSNAVEVEISNEVKLLRGTPDSPDNCAKVPLLQTSQISTQADRFVEITKSIKDTLSKLLTWDQTQMVYRHFAKDKNPEIYLEDLEKKYTRSSQKFYKVYTQLESLGYKDFNPELLRDLLVREDNQRAADRIEEDVEKWKLARE